jgi:carboxymethylenebutenolidase
VCYAADAVPPLCGEPVTGASGAPLILTSTDGARFDAYLARPDEAAGTGVLVLPDNRGLSGFYEHLTLRLAEQGHAALAIDYFGRTAGTGSHDRGAVYPGAPHGFFDMEMSEFAGAQADAWKRILAFVRAL